MINVFRKSEFYMKSSTVLTKKRSCWKGAQGIAIIETTLPAYSLYFYKFVAY